MFACGKQAGLSRLPLNRSASVSYNKIIEIYFSLFFGLNRLSLVKQVILQNNLPWVVYQVQVKNR